MSFEMLKKLLQDVVFYYMRIKLYGKLRLFHKYALRAVSFWTDSETHPFGGGADRLSRYLSSSSKLSSSSATFWAVFMAVAGVAKEVWDPPVSPPTYESDCAPFMSGVLNARLPLGAAGVEVVEVVESR